MPTYWESLLEQYGYGGGSPYNGPPPSYVEGGGNMLGDSPGHIPYLPPIYGDTPISAELGAWISRYLTPQHHQMSVTSPGGTYQYIGPSRNPTLRPEDVQSGIAMLELKAKLDDEEEKRKRNAMMDQILGPPSGGGSITPTDPYKAAMSGMRVPPRGDQFTYQIEPDAPQGPLTGREYAELFRGGINPPYGGAQMMGVGTPNQGQNPGQVSAKAIALANQFQVLQQRITSLQQEAKSAIGDPGEIRQQLMELNQERLDVLAKIQNENPTLYQMLATSMSAPQADVVFDGKRWSGG